MAIPQANGEGRFGANKESKVKTSKLIEMKRLTHPRHTTATPFFVQI